MLARFVDIFASRPKFTAGIWVSLLAFGVLSYTVLLPREGFPSVQIPVVLVNGQYFVGDAETVDKDLSQPITDAILEIDDVKEVQTLSRDNGLVVVTEFESGVDPLDGADSLQETLDGIALPEEAELEVQTIDASKWLEEFDLLVGVYGEVGVSAAELEAAAALALPSFSASSDIESASVVPLVQRGVNPATGEEQEEQVAFNQIAVKGDDGSVEVRPAVTVGVIAADGVDNLEARDATDAVLNQLAKDGTLGDDFGSMVAIDFATQIRQQIGSLENNVLTGIFAVSIIALLLISWRASIITGLFIFSVLATTVGILYLVGISLNTISLFGIILALGLFVDDAIVITEAIVSFREKDDPPREVIKKAISRVGTASVSGTLTTILVFAPMLFITGILGSFIRILPITVMISLAVSLILSLILIPVASRFIILNSPPTSGPLQRIEDKLADAVAAPVGVRGKTGVAVGLASVIFSIGFVMIGLQIFAPKVGFDIFPSQNDSIQVNASYQFPPTVPLEQAEQQTLKTNQAAVDALGDELEELYYSYPQLDTTPRTYTLTPVGSRATANELIDTQLRPVADEIASPAGPGVVFTQQSAGPPEELFPFRAQLFGEDLETLLPAAEKIASDLNGAVVQENDAEVITVTDTRVDFTSLVVRTDGRRMVEIRAKFDSDATTAATTATQTYLEDTFPSSELEALGLSDDAFGFDFGFESDNQESFASLPLAFGAALVMMLVLLVIQFRSAIQWLLVFLAIPFSFYGVFGGLLATGNILSFFVMLGLIGLIGIAVNNTILLTDFANQERKLGHDARTAIQNAIRRRFRPLVATTLTTIAGILPLALSDPFWEALGMTIVFGLLSSTFLVLLAFPFYYLATTRVQEGTRQLFRKLLGRERPKPART